MRVLKVSTFDCLSVSSDELALPQLDRY